MSLGAPVLAWIAAVERGTAQESAIAAAIAFAICFPLALAMLVTVPGLSRGMRAYAVVVALLVTGVPSLLLGSGFAPFTLPE